MVFSSSIFLFLFLPVTLLLYYNPLCRSINVRNSILLILSLVFYAWGEPIYIILMVFSISVNYYLGLRVEKCPKNKEGKRIVLIACIVNLSMLFVFKYLAWICSIFIGDRIHSTLIGRLSLPIGISFYTFQALSYVIDVYRGKDKAQKSIRNVGLYIAFFPQLIAGPIVRYGSIASQLTEREHTYERFYAGVRRFMIGVSKKLLIANNVAVLAEKAFSCDPSERSVLFAWAGALSFMLQIYYDFSGYSDMAIGLGKMFGFEFSENFNYPYVSKSITEYWRRWHISLGEWFRDYLFYPLSLGPAVRFRKRIARRVGRKNSGIIASVAVLFCVWMATGLWHGANMTFVLWGFLQFVFIVFEQYRKPLKNQKLGMILGFITTYLVVLVTKVMFNASSVSQAIYYYGSMLGLTGNSFLDKYGLYWVFQYKNYLFGGFVLSFPLIESIGMFLRKNSESMYKVYRGLLEAALWILFLLDIAVASSGSYNPFIYFNF